MRPATNRTERFQTTFMLLALRHGRNIGGDVPTTSPTADGVTAAALAERIEGFAAGTVQIRRSGQGYAPAVSSHEDSLSADVGLDGEDDDVERELAWVDVLPECDRRLFAEEMSQLLAEAAETDDFAEVQQTLREWRVTSEIYLDPELLKRLTEPLTANGDRVPRPVV